MDKYNLGVVRETFGKVTFTHKTYEKAADICNYRTAWTKRLNIILLVATSSSAFNAIIGVFFNIQDNIIITSILATTALFFSVYQYNFDYEKRADQYKTTATKLWVVREKYQNLIADIMSDTIGYDETIKQRDELVNEQQMIYECAPNTFPKAYKMAVDALNTNKEMSFTDSEIDLFLPEELRLKK